MAVVNNQKSFEQSLRSVSPYAPLLRPIKSEIHKGCTGKAHGCGTRKNSTYSSSLSDSSSEVSPAHSVSSSGHHHNGLPLRRTSSISKPRNNRREKSDTSCESVVTTAAAITSPSQTGNQSARRDKLPRLTAPKQDKRNGKSIDVKPPWHNVYTAKLTALNGGVATAAAASGSPRTENHDRVKRTRKSPTSWQEVYEKSYSQKLYGGTYLRDTFSNNVVQVIPMTTFVLTREDN